MSTVGRASGGDRAVPEPFAFLVPCLVVQEDADSLSPYWPTALKY